MDVFLEYTLQLVAQGFAQGEGIDFNDTFSPTANLTAVQIITTIAVRNDWELKQVDVDAAYLNASLKENIYMCQPKGFKVSGHEDKAIHLKRVIYGLRQSGHEWYEDLMTTLMNVGFCRCGVEHAMFYQFDQYAMILAVDVNDSIIASNSPKAMYVQPPSWALSLIQGGAATA